MKFINNRLALLENPKLSGKRLSGRLADYWVYRVGTIRILTRHENNRLIVNVIEVGNRREIYR
ncbi:MAG: type II toxin-antitoxin system RelE/ParE family toxin [Rhizobiaceae bacterium]|nr:type II toxin-antitoxin system RelE/ParE family toxin [Rhizobiaceae bacterium]